MLLCLWEKGKSYSPNPIRKQKRRRLSSSRNSYIITSPPSLFLPQLPTSTLQTPSLSLSENDNVVDKHGEEEHSAEELGRRDVRGGRERGDGVADDKAYDRRRLRSNRDPSAQRQKPNPRTRHRLLQEPRSLFRVQVRVRLQGTPDLGRRVHKRRPEHPLRTHYGTYTSFF